MKILKNKTLAVLIAILLAVSMSASMILMPSIIPSVSAHTPAWTIISYAYLTVAPSPVGVGQSVGVYMWVDHPIPGASDVPGAENTVRRMGYVLTITDPTGVAKTTTFGSCSDTTGIQMYYFTPTIVGNYTIDFNYPGQVYNWNSTNTKNFSSSNDIYYGDILTASHARPETLVVQQDAVASPATPSMPTAYWTYPIFGTNYNWYSVASNWLSGPSTPATAHSGNVQPFGISPLSAHVMWTNPIQFGGVVGGNQTEISGESYYQGGSYNTRFSNAIIMQGMLFFQLPFGETGTGGNYVAWDLKSGQQLWSINTSATGIALTPSFGYLPSMDQPNQHGILPDGLLVATTTAYTGLGTVWRTYDPMTGVLTPMNITNVPGGTNVAGPNGEYLKIALVNYGTTSKPNYYLQEWNSSKVFGIYAGTGTSYWYTGTENASLPSAYDWNVTVNLPMTPNDSAWAIGGLPTGPTQYSQASASGCLALGDLALLVQGSFGGHVNAMGAAVATGPVNVTALSLNPTSLGTTLWSQTYQPAPGNNTRVLAAWDPSTGVFILWDQELMDQIGFSLATGNQLWGPVNIVNGTNTDWNYMGDGTTQENVAYGNLYWAGYSGQLYCFNDTTGALEYTFGNSNTPDNSTCAGIGTPYGYYPIFICAIANGVVYLSSTEHSPNSPLYANYDIRAINATTGLQMWGLPSFGNLMYSAYTPVASGYLVTDNTYSQELYCFGQGPSALTVTAPDTASNVGTPIIIRGTVLDVSAGTQQAQQKADFPYGVPAVSDASQSCWMQYVYQQQPMPTNVVGVPVTISVVDSNNNTRTIGTVTSDASGMFTLSWTPDITGPYTVIANFAGTNSYYPSSAETSFVATNPAGTASPYPVTVLPPTETYFALSTIAIIAAVAIIGAIIIVSLRKRA